MHPSNPDTWCESYFTAWRTKASETQNKFIHTPVWYEARLSLKHDDSHITLSVSRQSFTRDEIYCTSEELRNRGMKSCLRDFTANFQTSSGFP